MKWFNNLRFASKLGLLLAPGIIAFIGLPLWGAYGEAINGDIERQQENLTRLRSDTMSSALIATQYGAAVENDIKDTSQSKRIHLSAVLKDINKNIPAIVTDAVSLEKPLRELVKQIDTILKTNAAPDEGVSDEADLLGDIVADFNQRVSKQSETLATLKKQVRERYNKWTVFIILMGIMMFTAILIIMKRVVLTPLNQVNILAGKLANGDLTQRLEYSTNDEFGELASSLNVSVINLQRVVTEVDTATQHLSHSALTLTTETEKTSDGVRQQHMETDQLATAITEMAATVHEVASSASTAAEAASSADEEANFGKQVVEQVSNAIKILATEVNMATNAIHTLKTDSEAIGSIVDVINGIAEQTNLLALNAAIEAARAGESGRGFAVVADEVRTLAQRTHASTKEIKQIVDTVQEGAVNAADVMQRSHQQAEITVEEAVKAARSLDTITGAVAKINEMNTQIACAAEEQGTVAEELNRNIIAISEISDRNAEGANAITSDSNQLSSLANKLDNIVKQFKV